ncbi:lysozyme inhibitor LprI family protein [Oceanisphaera psychrotolerans]|nr:lysozyme inhibitor LprI family protein [Oceanisphaera psychrotolerans]
MKTVLILPMLAYFMFLPPGYGQSATQLELNQAANRQYTAADLALNKAYSQLMRSLQPKRQQQLKVAQRAWLKFRDAQAELVSSAYTGGSIRPLIHSQALRELTEHRTAELTRMYRDDAAQ